MIRELRNNDLDDVMDIWLNVNLQAHPFVEPSYWKNNSCLVREILPQAEVYVYEIEGKIVAFVGLEQGYIAGIFVTENMQSKGIGKVLLDYCKEREQQLSLKVFEQNKRAVQFYLREGFSMEKKVIDEQINQIEYVMVWKR